MNNYNKSFWYVLIFFNYFRDIFSALSDGATCKLLQEILVKVIRTKYPDVEAIVGIESRGFLFAFSIAAELGIGCLVIRKKGKLPGDVFSYKYDLEYGSVSITYFYMYNIYNITAYDSCGQHSRKNILVFDAW